MSQAEYAEAVRLYSEVDASVRNTKLKSLYLTTLYYEDKEHYREKLIEELSEVSADLDGVIDIAFGVHEKSYLKDDVIPLIKKHIVIMQKKNQKFIVFI